MCIRTDVKGGYKYYRGDTFMMGKIVSPDTFMMGKKVSGYFFDGGYKYDMTPECRCVAQPARQWKLIKAGKWPASVY